MRLSPETLAYLSDLGDVQARNALYRWSLTLPLYPLGSGGAHIVSQRISGRILIRTFAPGGCY
jgi:hypothetical protein